MSDNNKTCTVGGYDIIFPPEGWNDNRMPNHTNPFVAIAGDDPEFPAFKECCGPHPVHFVEPCIMWCDTNGDVNEYTQCWHDHDFDPKASSGMARIPDRFPWPRHGCIVALFVVAALVLFIMHNLIKRFRARRASKKQYQQLPQSEVPEVEQYYDHSYGTLNSNNRVDNKQQI